MVRKLTAKAKWDKMSLQSNFLDTLPSILSVFVQVELTAEFPSNDGGEYYNSQAAQKI